VARPKIDTATLSRPFSSSTSSTMPVKEVNGPSLTRTCSPISKMIARFGRSMPSLHLVLDPHRSASEIRRGLALAAEEAGHLRRVHDEMPGLVGQFHLHQHVAGEELALGVHLGATPHLDHFLGRTRTR